MAETLPINLPLPSESAIASYNFTEVATATGYITYLPLQTSDTYLLQSNTIYSDLVLTYAETGNTSATKVIDIDFDLVFNLPRVLKGIGFVSVPIVLYARDTGKTNSAYIIAKLRKWDGTTETDIITNQSDTFSSASTSTNQQDTARFTIDLDIPKTLIKKGETLRLTIEGWLTAGTTTVAGLAVGHDPKDRSRTNRDARSVDNNESITFGTDPSSMILNAPFRIDL